jgi:hypothetical protein
MDEDYLYNTLNHLSSINLLFYSVNIIYQVDLSSELIFIY